MTARHPRQAYSGTVRLAYSVYGESVSAAPLLMIMGLSGVKEDWHDLPQWLARDRPVAVFDNRGMGDSDVPEGPYSIEQLADDALSLMDALNWDHAHVMGISMGGMIALALSLAAPERVGRLVLGCTSDCGRLNPAPDREAMSAMMPTAGTSPRDALAKALAINYTPDWIERNPVHFQSLVDRAGQYRRRARGILGQISAISRFDMADQVRQLTSPSLVIHGDKDRLIPMANGQRLATRLPNARFEMLMDCGHLFWHMDDGRSADLIREFLASPG
ncbi:alpha/beta fold hydrolase [Candidatus Macondimonas diazotrophica]|jgi:pimeloyl-ACP methyl ester carboxylesterase|uniref:Alpha/beta fold hydrolase n=1 Tax=Candidatus Macondimonas diazotrophica TaxID=2305248 RepID=A0A4Z0FB76_9GAMM|nr:alpha/beta hydrolase [Candidatus Macondimonas diazotrophica]NCU01791.1 alpha/beta fold hydrolase [Candidatus Macondimonas diazotrophica]TFZ82935.1 alpha/beta fold hydrolase [Candidatus Macondimonas diazotrophica]HBG32105.1 hypothetical protein [Gammaproteobacteria bacterium]HBG52487.1 hypothetical protein [Gammaproteobacteria bacterium]